MTVHLGMTDYNTILCYENKSLIERSVSIATSCDLDHDNTMSVFFYK